MNVDQVKVFIGFYPLTARISALSNTEKLAFPSQQEAINAIWKKRPDISCPDYFLIYKDGDGSIYMKATSNFTGEQTDEYINMNTGSIYK
ncbi:MAG: hypothetical protein ACK5NK_14985 [Niabella sp.]